MPITLLCVLLHLYVGWRLVPALGSLPAAIGLGVLLLASAVLLPTAFRARRRRLQDPAHQLVVLGLWLLGLFSSVLVLTVLRDLMLLVGWIVWRAMPGLLDIDALARWTAALVPLLAVGITLLGLFNARRTASVVSVDVPIERLPPALHGFTIAQISDLHVGPTIRRPYLERIVGAVNRIGADMVAITGDLVDGSVQQLASHVEPLARLESRHGTFFVTGNHDYYSGAPAWIAELRRLGIRVLLNEHVVLRPDEGAVVIDRKSVV